MTADPVGAPTGSGVRRPGRRPWTRLGVVAIEAHVFYELAAGVGMPLASRIGPVAASTLFGASGAILLREAGRQPASRDRAFAALNGLFLAAVVAHFTAWPRRRVAGAPWLTECEGLAGRVIAPYNVVLYVSAVSAVAGLMENRRGILWGLAVPAVAVRWLAQDQHREHRRLRALARQRPAWWNRRL